jgi:hypothetical protein
VLEIPVQIIAAHAVVWFWLAGLAVAQTPTVGNCTVFPADNIWNARIDELPVHPSSSTWVNTIGPSKPLHPDFGSGTYDGAPIGIPYITVPGTQTKYPATFQYQSESDPGPYAIPLNAPIEGGSSSSGDRHVISVDMDNCILYEIYDAFPQAASWQGGSGAIFNLASDALRPASWTSADAAGLPIFAGLVRYDEVAAGAIYHAIRFTAPQTQASYVWPARHYASSLTGPQYPPMGARFRLKSSFDISSFSAANQIILTALMRYGMMLADNGSSWFISGATDSRWNNDDLHALTTLSGSDFEAVDATTLMVDPNSGETVQPVGAAGPSVVSVAPNSGSSARQAFVLKFADPNGAADIASAQIDINATMATTNGCYLSYERESNTISLASNEGGFEAGLVIGRAGTSKNSQCEVNAGASSVSMSGDTLTLSLALTFNSSFAGGKNIYLEARNATADTGWSQQGTWTVPANTFRPRR